MDNIQSSSSTSASLTSDDRNVHPGHSFTYVQEFMRERYKQKLLPKEIDVMNNLNTLNLQETNKSNK